MKGMLWITLTFFLIIISCSAPSERSMTNEKNINKIRIGMKLNQVKDTMGIPDQILIDPFNDKEFDVVYIAPSKYDDDFHVYVLRQDSSVVRIVNGR
jgi:outer membrane protein assembly factor BamE (lipoprotein component of BamABCDE complex)